MSWENVKVGDLIEYHARGSLRKFGIYLGITEEIEIDISDGIITGLPAMHMVYKDGIDYIPVDTGISTKVEVRSSLKSAKG